MTSPLSFGAWVRRRRKALHITQRYLAEQVGCSHETIRKIEAGSRRPSVPMAERLAHFLEVDPAERPGFVRAALRGSFEADAAPGPQPVAPRDEPPGLIGRAPLIAQLESLLRSPAARLVTLTGPGGVGKTTLAQHVAGSLREGGASVTFVSLATTMDPDQVLPAVAQALGVAPSGLQHPLAQLIAHIGQRPMLLVLDNLEQVVAVGGLLAELLVGCPALTLVTTSRIPLRVPSELVVEVPPLAAPAPSDAPAPEALPEWPATALFLARAREARPDGSITAADAQAIAEICRLMDGLPLAIELVAMRCAVLDPPALRDRLKGAHGYEPLELPRRPFPASTPRHQGLRDAIGWSFALLSPPQRRLFTWLCAFRGGAATEAVEQVCAAAGLRPVEVLDGLQALVDAHLVLREAGADGPLRFTLLLTIQEYAQEQLAAAGELAAARQAHADFYLALARQLDAQLESAEQSGAMAAIEREQDNFRAALGWLSEHDLAQAAELGAALWWSWYLRGTWREGLGWLTLILERSAQRALSLPPEAHLHLLNGAATLAKELAQYDQARALYEQGLAIARGSGAWRRLSAMLNNLAGLHHTLGDLEAAQEHMEEALAVVREHGHTFPDGAYQEAFFLGGLGVIAVDAGRFAEGRRYLDESLALMRRIGNEYGQANTMLYLGQFAIAHRDHVLAEEYYSRALAILRAHDDARTVAFALAGLGWVCYLRGEYWQALRYQQDALRLAWEQGAQRAIVMCLAGCGDALGALGDLRAAHLYGLAERLREQHHISLYGVFLEYNTRAVAASAAHHDPAVWAAAWKAGRALAPDEVVGWALALQEPQ